MAAGIKRFSITITPKMNEDLDSLKQGFYYRNSQTDMFRDLITRGLAAIKAEESAHKKTVGRVS